jgi:hypothetical protein
LPLTWASADWTKEHKIRTAHLGSKSRLSLGSTCGAVVSSSMAQRSGTFRLSRLVLLADAVLYDSSLAWVVDDFRNGV